VIEFWIALLKELCSPGRGVSINIARLTARRDARESKWSRSQGDWALSHSAKPTLVDAALTAIPHGSNLAASSTCSGRALTQ
jgi:hypothetical protein